METDSRNLATCFICIRNDSNRYVHLRKGHVVGRAEEIDCVMPNCIPNLEAGSSHSVPGEVRCSPGVPATVVDPSESGGILNNQSDCPCREVRCRPGDPQLELAVEQVIQIPLHASEL